MSELARLIAEQQADMRSGDRVWSVSLDAFPSGADLPRPRLLVTDDRHGTLNGYIHLRCRCDKCKAASAQAKREQRARKRAKRGPYKDRYFCADCGSLHVKRERVYLGEGSAAGVVV